MKLTLVILLAAILQSLATESYSQTATLLIDLKNATVLSVIQQIEDQSDFVFLYSRTVVDVERLVNVEVKDAKISEVLSLMFNGTDVAYKVDEKQIVLSRKESDTNVNTQEQKNISGKVTDAATGQSIPGTIIIVKGTTIGTRTDINGDFSLNVPTGNTLLTFSFMGYISQDIPLEGKTQLNVALSENVINLNEVVAIGYGVQKKSDLTGAVVSISAEDLQATSPVNITNALQGRAAGIYVQATTGAPGANVNIKIRGITSINGTNPLWIVDGVPADPNAVNPADIESVEILKDASSASIYGANGANGVVLVTTKQGKAGKTTISFNAYTGVQSANKLLDMADGPQFAKMYTEYETLLKMRKYTFNDTTAYPSYDHQKEIFRSAPIKNYDLSASGGNEKSDFYFGIGYTTQEGILKNSSFDKLTLRLNSKSSPNKWLTIGENIALAWKKYAGFEEWKLLDQYNSPILAAIQYHPFVPPYDETGNWSYTPLGNTPNPVGMVELLHNDNQSYSTKATVFAIVEPIKGLRYETRLSGTLGFGDSYNFMPVYFITPSNKNSNSRISRNSSSGYDWLWQNTLSYNRSLFDDHNISIMGGMESGYGKSSWMGAERLDLINESENMWYFNASTNGTNLSQLPQGSASESSGYSYFGRLSYDYKGIFLLQGNVRKDYSSRFGPRNRSGVFPSYSAGFKFTELDVVKKSLPFLDFGKIRYGWGKVGNNAIPEYVYFSTVALLDVLKYPFSNDATSSQGAGRDRAVNTSVAWEGVVTRNIGVDLGFLNNRLTITTDFFKRFNEGMLMEVPPPLMGGWIIRTAYWENNNVSSNPIANVGRIGNSGIEFSGTWKETRGKFKYGVDANFSWIKTLVDEITPDTLYRGTAKGLGGFLTETIQGNAIGEYYGYKTNGLFRPSDADTINGKVVVTNQPYTIAADGTTKVYAQAKAKPGDFRFIDANNDGKINNKDAVPLGNPNPKFLFGLNLNLEYNGIDFSMFWQGVAGNKIFNAVKFYQFNTDGGFNWSADYVENHYREALYNRAGKLMFEANPDGKYPRLDPKNDNNNFSTVSDFYIEDGSYLRLKNMQLGYTFPNRWTSKAGISRFRIYFSANNLLTLTKYTGYDPEVGSTDILVQGLDRGAYPTAKLYLMGINLNF